MGIVDGRRKKVETFVAPHLESGESIDAVLSFAQTGGPKEWVVGVSALLKGKYGAVVVTDDRVLLVQISSMGKPKELATAVPRSSVKVLRDSSWKIRNNLTLEGLADKPVQLDAPGIHGKEVRAVVEALAPEATTSEA